MALWRTSSGGAAVAQPAAGAARLERACVLAYALITLGLSIWAGSEVWRTCGGTLGAPLDDSYIHFQFARSFARFSPFEYVPGLPKVAGATSLLWPALLVPAIWAGASGPGLVAVTWLLGFGSLFGQAREVLLAGRRFLGLPFAFFAGLLVLAFSANTWFAASAMEVVPLGFVLLRSARRGAEYAAGLRSTARAWELGGLGLAGALLRPEGALAALLACGAFVSAGRREWWRAGLVLLTPLVVPGINLIFAGGVTQTTTAAKWLPMNPYYSGRLGAALLGNLTLFVDTLLDGREWSWTFIPEGYRVLALASLPALAYVAARRGARAHALCLCLVGLGMLIPASYETFLVNRLRYLWPFAGPWLLGLAALGQLAASVLERVWPRLGYAGLLLPAAAGLGFARLLPVSVDDLATSASAINAQQVSLGRWAAVALPEDAKLGVNDAGAITFYSGRKTFDIVGLTTQGEARYWVAGAGSRFEHYERLPRAALPTHFIVYPEWFGIPSLLGDCLTERRVDGATILGGPLMVACTAEYASLGSGARPTLDVGARRLLDELDVADLESETAHDYELGHSSQWLNVIVASPALVDGGRAGRSGERLRLNVEPGGLLVMRLGASRPTRLSLSIAGQPAVTLTSAAAAPQELSMVVPAGVRAGTQVIALSSSEPVTSLHYWSYSARQMP